VTRHQCGEALIRVNLLVPDEHRIEIARLLGMDYSVGPGSGIPLSGLLYPSCRQVQIKPARVLGVDPITVVSEHRAGSGDQP
jgi:hypothetical protein